EYGEVEPVRDRSTSPCLNVSQYLFSRRSLAFFSILLATPDILQHIEPVHDLFHVGGVRQPLDGVEGFLLCGMQLHGGVPHKNTATVYHGVYSIGSFLAL